MPDRQPRSRKTKGYREIAKTALTLARNGKGPTGREIIDYAWRVERWIVFYRNNFQAAARYQGYAAQKAALKEITEHGRRLLATMKGPHSLVLTENLYGAYTEETRAEREAEEKRHRPRPLAPEIDFSDFIRNMSDFKQSLEQIEYLSRCALRDFEKPESPRRVPTHAKATIKRDFAVSAIAAFDRISDTPPTRINRKRTNERGAVHQEPEGAWNAFLLYLMKAILKDIKGVDDCSQYAVAQLKAKL